MCRPRITPRPGVHTVGPVIDPAPHTRLAMKEAQRFLARNLWAVRKGLIGDVFSAAMLGLTLAAWGFRPAKGFKFSTYATWAIRHSLWHWAEEQQKKACQVYGDLTFDDLQDAQENDARRQAERQGEDARREEERREARATVERLIGRLEGRERWVVRGHLAGKTYRVMAGELKLSKERVRQLLESAKRRMRGKGSKVEW